MKHLSLISKQLAIVYTILFLCLFSSQPLTGQATFETGLFRTYRPLAPNSYIYKDLTTNKTSLYNITRSYGQYAIAVNQISTNQSFYEFIPQVLGLNITKDTNHITAYAVLHNQTQLRTQEGNFFLEAVQNRTVLLHYTNVITNQTINLKKTILLHIRLQEPGSQNEFMTNIFTGISDSQTFIAYYMSKEFNIGGTFKVTYFPTLQNNASIASNTSSSQYNLQVHEIIETSHFNILINSNPANYTAPDISFPIHIADQKLSYIITTDLSLPSVIHRQQGTIYNTYELAYVSWNGAYNKSYSFNFSNTLAVSPGFELLAVLAVLPIIAGVKRKHGPKK